MKILILILTERCAGGDIGKYDAYMANNRFHWQVYKHCAGGDVAKYGTYTANRLCRRR